MPSLISRAARFARSPQGQRLADQAKKFIKKPENRRKVDDLRRRFARRA